MSPPRTRNKGLGLLHRGSGVPASPRRPRGKKPEEEGTTTPKKAKDRVYINVEWAARALAHQVPRQRTVTAAAYRPFLNTDTRVQGSVWAKLAKTYNRRWRTDTKPNSLYVNYSRNTALWLKEMEDEYDNPQLRSPTGSEAEAPSSPTPPSSRERRAPREPTSAAAAIEAAISAAEAAAAAVKPGLGLLSPLSRRKCAVDCERVVELFSGIEKMVQSTPSSSTSSSSSSSTSSSSSSSSRSSSSSASSGSSEDRGEALEFLKQVRETWQSLQPRQLPPLFSQA